MEAEKTINYGKIGDVDLADIPALAECHPGAEPVEYNLLIAPAVPPKMAGKIGLIMLPDSAKDQLGLAQQVGLIAAASPLAFNFDHWPDDARKPQVGDVIWYARYAGGLVTGTDGREYRLIKDKDVGMVIRRAEVWAALKAA